MKYKFTIFIFLFSILFYSIAFPQGKITGYVKDKKEGIPIEGAVVKIFLNSDSTVKKGTSTDSRGYFSIEKIKSGTYKLVISEIGYHLYNKTNVVIDEDNPVIFLDTIKLSQYTYTTEEITVESEAPVMELKDEKKVFNIEKILSTKGGTAIEVLKKIPMVDVDANDNVTLRGSTNARILVDNKPMKFASLRQIPADAIKTVEIITNPSAKYEAEGVTGIINIVMKAANPNMAGYNGFIYGSFSDKTRYYLTGGINLKVKKWSFFLNAGGGFFKYVTTFNSNVNYQNPVAFYESNSTGEGNNRYGFPSLGLEYEISKNHNIGFDAYTNFSWNNNNNFSKNNNFNGLHNLTSYYTNDVVGNGNWKNYSGSAYYNGKFKKGSELNLELAYTGSKGDNTGSQNILNYDSLLTYSNSSIQKNITDNKTDYYRLQMDFYSPLGKKTNFETGYKGTFNLNDNDFHSDTLNNITNGFVENVSVTNHFKLSDYINAVYTTLTQKIKNFRFKIGLRLEHTYSKGELITDNSSFTKNYLDLFPTLNISQKFGLSNEISASYSRRITRPMIYRLNPFVNKYNNKFIYQGNPELTPEFTDSFELTYSFTSNVASVTPMLFYRKSYDVISNYSYVIDTDVRVSTYRNSAGAQAYGLDLILNSNAFKWWNLNSTFSFYKSRFEGDITNDYSAEEGFSWQARIRSTFSFAKIFNIELYYNYIGKKISSNGFNDPSQSFDIVLNKMFFKNKFSISFRAQDIFNTSKYGGETNGTGVTSTYTSQWNIRSVTLNFSYNFGNTEKYYSKTKKTKQNENESQDSSNDNIK